MDPESSYDKDFVSKSKEKKGSVLSEKVKSILSSTIFKIATLRKPPKSKAESPPEPVSPPDTESKPGIKLPESYRTPEPDPLPEFGTTRVPSRRPKTSDIPEKETAGFYPAPSEPKSKEDTEITGATEISSKKETEPTIELTPASEAFLIRTSTVVKVGADNLDDKQRAVLNDITKRIDFTGIYAPDLNGIIADDSLKNLDLNSFVDKCKKGIYYVNSETVNAALVVSWLIFTDLMKEPMITPERRGALIDHYLIQTRILASKLTLDKNVVDFITSELSSICEMNLPGLDKEIRKSLGMQAMQFMSLNSHQYETLTSRYDNRMLYPEERDKNTLDQLSKTPTSSELLSTIFALTSPYKVSLGKSSLGKENLEKLIEVTHKATELLDQFPAEDTREKQLAEQAIGMQLYHLKNDEVNEQFLAKLSPESRIALEEYIGYRGTNPLWKDRLDIFKRYSDDLHSIEVDTKDTMTRIVCSTDVSALISTLNDGEYITLHEAFKGNGSVSLSTRSTEENRLMLLASGTADDPFMRYGSIQIIQSYGYEQFHYGSYSLILKPEVLDRATATKSDSFSSREFPITGKDPITKAKLRGDYISYLEAQVHGGLLASDFEAIVINNPSIDSATKIRIQKLADKLSIPVITPHDYGDYKKKVKIT